MARSPRRSGLQKSVDRIFESASFPEEARMAPPTRSVSPPRARAVRETPPADPVACEPRPENRDPQAQGITQGLCAKEDAYLRQLQKEVRCGMEYACCQAGAGPCKTLFGGRLLVCAYPKDGPCPHRLSVLGKAFCRCDVRQYKARLEREARG